MIEIAPTVAISAGASLPLAALGRNTFEPGTGMHGIAAGPAASLDLGVRLGHYVLPFVTFERAWVSCDQGGYPCRATNDAIALSVRVTSRGRVRVFGDVGVGARWLTTDPTPMRLNGLVMMQRAGSLENRGGGSDSADITWTGLDALRLGVGAAYALRDEAAIEFRLGCAMGSFREVRTGTILTTNLSPNEPLGFDAKFREEKREPYYIFGLTVAVRGFLPLR